MDPLRRPAPHFSFFSDPRNVSNRLIQELKPPNIAARKSPIMTQKNPLQLKAAETIKFLKDENLITKEHSFTIALILELAAEWSACTSSTQRAGISKELRAAYELLPKPEATVSDEAAEFLASLTEDD